MKMSVHKLRVKPTGITQPKIIHCCPLEGVTYPP